MTDEHYFTLAEHYFTLAEAEALKGRRYRATAGCSGVPAGTTGTVVEPYQAGDGWGVDVRWDLPGPELVDGFSKRHLHLVFSAFAAGPIAGERAMVPLDGPDGGPAVTETGDTWRSLAIEAASLEPVMWGVGRACAFCRAAWEAGGPPRHKPGCLTERVAALRRWEASRVLTGDG